MSYLDAIILGIIQGLTEFLPVSSSGHLALGQHILGMTGTEGLFTFDLMLHAATLFTVLIYFRKKLFALLSSLWQKDRKEDHFLIFLLFIGTLPIVAIGFLFKDSVEHVAENPVTVSLLLCGTGLILLLPKWFKRTASTGNITLRSAVIMGFGQALAILPGISRSGTTIATGILSGVAAPRAAEFSFLLAIPAITGAMVLKAKDISGISATDIGPYIAGMGAAFLFGLIAVYAVLASIRKGKFQYFAYYCIALGITGLIFFSLSQGS